jgi:hypothetical protein
MTTRASARLARTPATPSSSPTTAYQAVVRITTRPRRSWQPLRRARLAFCTPRSLPHHPRLLCRSALQTASAWTTAPAMAWRTRPSPPRLRLPRLPHSLRRMRGTPRAAARHLVRPRTPTCLSTAALRVWLPPPAQLPGPPPRLPHPPAARWVMPLHLHPPFLRCHLPSRPRRSLSWYHSLRSCCRACRTTPG